LPVIVADRESKRKGVIDSATGTTTAILIADRDKITEVLAATLDT
jgi:hypothetical protein